MRTNDQSSNAPAARRRRIGIAMAVAMLCVAYLAPARKPLANTDEYRAAHGIVHGRVNEIRVKGLLFRFPAAYLPEPETSDGIVRGQADTVRLHADLSFLLVPAPEFRSEAYGLVRIEIRAQGFEDVRRKQERLAGHGWESTRERPDLGMREYIEHGDSGGWGYRAYASDDPRWRTPRGGPIVFDCAGMRGSEPSQCRAAYQHPRGPLIVYYLSWNLLPRWREAHREVVGRVDSFILE